MKIITYMKPSCGWSNGVRSVMRKYDLPFEDRDIINDPIANEMVGATDQEADTPTNQACADEVQESYITFKEEASQSN